MGCKMCLPERWLRKMHLPLVGAHLQEKLTEFITMAKLWQDFSKRLPLSEYMLLIDEGDKIEELPQKLAKLFLSLREQVNSHQLNHDAFVKQLAERDKQIKEQQEQISRLELTVLKLDEQRTSYAAQLTNVKEALKKEEDAAREAIGYQKKRLHKACQFASLLGLRALALKERIRMFAKREEELIGAILQMEWHRILLFEPKERIAIAEAAILRKTLGTVESLNLPAKFKKPLPPEEVDTARMPMLEDIEPDTLALAIEEESIVAGAPNIGAG